MAATAQVKPLRWDDDVLHALQPVVAASPWGGLATVGEAMQGAYLFDYTHGRQHALIAVRPVQFAAGRRLDVVGLLSDGERLQAGPLDGALLAIARDLESSVMAMTTQLPHVIKTCQRAAWQITGAVLTKRLEALQ